MVDRTRGPVTCSVDKIHSQAIHDVDVFDTLVPNHVTTSWHTRLQESNLKISKIRSLLRHSPLSETECEQHPASGILHQLTLLPASAASCATLRRSSLLSALLAMTTRRRSAAPGTARAVPRAGRT